MNLQKVAEARAREFIREVKTGKIEEARKAAAQGEPVTVNQVCVACRAMVTDKLKSKSIETNLRTLCMVVEQGLGLTAAEVEAVTLDKLTGETIRRFEDRFAWRKVGTSLYLVNHFGGWWKLTLKMLRLFSRQLTRQMANSTDSWCDIMLRIFRAQSIRLRQLYS